MAKATLKKTVSNYAKADKLFLQRTGDSVYICDYYTVIRIPNLIYESCFCVTSPRFPMLKDGDMLRADGKKELPTQEGTDISRIYPKNGNPVERLGIAKVISISENILAEVFRARNQLIYLDSKYIAIAYELTAFCEKEEEFNFLFRTRATAADEKPKSSPVIWNLEGDISMMILPINIKNDWLASLDGVEH